MSSTPRQFFYYLLNAGLVVMFYLTGSCSSQAQDRYLEIFRKYARPQFYSETVAFPLSHPDSVTVYTGMRLSYDNLYFIKQADNQFRAEIFVSQEIYRDKKLVSRKMQKRFLETTTFSKANDRNSFFSSFFAVNLAYGDYEFVLEVYDNDRQKQLKLERKTISFKKPSPPFNISQPLLVYRPSQRFETLTSDRRVSFEPLNTSGNALYGKDFVFLFQINGNKTPDSLRYDLFQLSGESERLIKSSAVAQHNFALNAGLSVPASGDSVFFSLLPYRSATPMPRVAMIDVKGEELPNARYRLVVYGIVEGKKVQLESKFETSWLDMPFGLYDLTLSIRLMEYITPPDSLSGINSGNIDEQRRKFLAFWKSQDPTPETDYNEVMTEYFKRVDYAFLNFYTPREYGWRTDRGKTYILYGEPSKVEREFPANRSVRELWFYESIQRKFVFVDRTNTGTYELESIEAITP